MRKISRLLLFFLIWFPVVVLGAERQLTIKRDNFGVPHIYANTAYGLFYGYGYAVAQDRLFQMEMAKRSTQGKVAEVLGEKFIEYDRGIRSNFSPPLIQKQLDGLSKNDLDIFEGYAAGMNAWLMEIQKNPEKLLPKEFTEFGFQPQEWTAYDVAMIFVGTMANRYGDFNTEPTNRQILDNLVKMHGEAKGKALFDLIKPRMTDTAPTTIPSGEWKNPSPALSEVDSLRYLPGEPLHQVALGGGNVGTPGIGGMSNCVVIGREKALKASSILMNGPQFGWYTPAYVYSIGLHGAGFDLVGNTPFAYPTILFGLNRHIAWGSTWGAGDQVDIYQEKLNPNNPREYFYKGKYLPLEERTELIKVKGGKDVSLTVYRTIHGPVISMNEKDSVALAKKRTWEGRELDSLLGWVHSCKARNFKEWLVQAKRNALNVNWYYADEKGNIGYVFTGKYPQRALNHDNRLPVSGLGDQEWLGLLPFSQTPKVLNPKQGYLANWNNKPAAGVLNPDEFWFSWGRGDRVEVLTQLLAKRKKWDPEAVWGLIEPVSYTDVQAAYFLPFLKKAAAKSQDIKIRQAGEILSSWNRISMDRDGDGYYDEAATAIFRYFLPRMIELALKDNLGESFNLFAATGYPEPGKPTASGGNIQTGTKAIIEALYSPPSQGYDLFKGKEPEAVILKALTAAVEALEKEQGPEMTKWRIPAPPRPFGYKNFLGIPQTLESETLFTRIEQNRGTENDLIVFTPKGVKAYEVVPPGQSGFISPDGTKSRHFKDQMKLYETFGKKRMWLYPADVEKNKESEIVLKY